LEPHNAESLAGGEVPATTNAAGTHTEIAVAPYPIYNPTLGAGLALAAVMVLPRTVKDMPPTTIGAGGFVSENDSWAIGGGIKSSLYEDFLRLTVGGGVAHINYDFYGIGDAAANNGKAVELTQDAALLGSSALFRCAKGLYVGPTAVLRRISIEPSNGLLQPPLNQTQDSGGVGITVEYDTRTNTFFPRDGWYVQCRALRYLESDLEIASLTRTKEPYTTCTLAINSYMGIGRAGVLAWRIASEWVGDAAPFYDLPMFGAHSDLRGYEAGRYRDRTLVAGQAEYRHELGFWRLGGVAFAGVGAVAPSYAALADADALPAGGLGLRWTAATDNHINLRVDFAWSRDGEAWYISVGEAF
jgi:hypothetical protein